MKFLVVGIGSMGERRIRNLTRLNLGPIAGFDLREDRRTEAAKRYGVAAYDDLTVALDDYRPEAVIVSTPPNKHMEIAGMVLERGMHVFCEVGTTAGGMREVFDLAERKGLVAAASCTMRFHPSVKKMKALIDAGAIGRVLAYTHQCGQYLPDWHKHEDYRAFYVSQVETSACREMVVFELTWLNWLVGGSVDLVTAMHGKVTDLECEVDDVYQLLLRYRGGALCHLMIDVAARAAVRSTRVLGSDGTLEWYAQSKVLRHFDAQAQAWTEYPEPEAVVQPGYSETSIEGMYIEEMDAFAKACRREAPFPNSFADDLNVLETLSAAETAFSTQSHRKLG